MAITYSTGMTVTLTVVTVVYVHNSIRPRIIVCENLFTLFEGLVIELFFNLKKWLLICSYNPHRNIMTGTFVLHR